MDKGFWQGKSVLVTGHTGFKGSWLSLWLQSMGARVTGFAMAPPTHPNMFESADVAKGMNSIIGDVRYMAGLNYAFQDNLPEIVFHLAAQPIVRYSYKHPVETYNTNVMGTINLLECVKACPSVKTVVNITTDKVYDYLICSGYRETDPLGGFDPYSSSKACSELVTSAYRSSYFVPKGVGVATARAGNVIGGGDWAEDRLVPDAIRSFTNNTPVIIRNPNAIRPWQHVLEPLRGYLDLAEALYREPVMFASAFNFGPKNEKRTVLWIIQQLADLCGTGALVKVEFNQPHETQTLTLDCSKARDLLGWEPSECIPIGLMKTVEWYRAFYRGEDMYQFTLNQISDYERSFR